MFRTAPLVSAWLVVVLSCCAVGQEAAGRQRSSRLVRPGTAGRVVIEGRQMPRATVERMQIEMGKRVEIDGHAQGDRHAEVERPSEVDRPVQVDRPVEASKPVERARHPIRVRPTAPPIHSGNLADSLGEFGARGPFGVSVRGGYLVAGLADGDGLAIWETKHRTRLRRLEDSERPYALIAISTESRWIAAVRAGDSDEIDLWRADNGRHVGMIRAAGGAKQQLAFQPNNELHVLSADGQERVFSVPTGAALSGPEVAGDADDNDIRGDTRAPKPGLARSGRGGSAKSSRPAAPSTTRAPLAAERELPPDAAAEAEGPAIAPPKAWGPRVPRIPVSPSVTAPRTARDVPSETFPVPAPPAVPRAREEEEPAFEPMAAPAAQAPAEPTFDFGGSAPDEPGSAAPSEPGSAAPNEPSGGSAPETVNDSDWGGPSGGAAPDEYAPGSAAPDEVAPGSAAPDDVAPGSAAQDETTTSDAEGSEAVPDATIHAIEMNDPLPAGAAPAAPVTSQPPVASAATTAGKKPSTSSVTVHYATNRNRLAPKDRELLVYFFGFFGSLPAFIIYGMVLATVMILPWLGKRSWGAWGALAGAMLLCSMALVEAYVRSQLRDEMTGEAFGTRATDLSFGACEVSVPPAENRRPGDMSRPLSLWVFEAPENPDKHFMLRHLEEHKDKDAFYRSLSAQLKQSEDQAALLFIHGYNVSFEDAIFRTAQLAVDLKFPGAPISFCWPSRADPMKYAFDEQSAEVSILALREVLDDLATRSGAKRIHIIAHSMGNRVLAGALQNLEPAKEFRNKELIRELVLAAPDIDSRVFRSQVLPHLLRNTQHCTLYASSRDRALRLSRFFHNYQRLGETQPELVVASGLDTIDASMVDTSLLGHSYIGDVASIVSDLHDLVVGGKRPAERLGLMSQERNALKYWEIKPEQVETATDSSLRR